jgi:putative flavoprotein involved in K+ transport
LIADGSIKLRSGVRVEALGEHTALLGDGSELPADVVVYATGYDRAPAAKVLPEEIAHRVGRRWGFGSGIGNNPGPSERELRNMRKPTRQTGLWFHSHGIGAARSYSQVLALEIRAREVGIPTRVYKLAEVYHKG